MADRDAVVPIDQGQAGLVGDQERRANGGTARVLFCVHDGAMVLLHGFIKKSQKTPDHLLDLATRRMKGLR